MLNSNFARLRICVLVVIVLGHPWVSLGPLLGGLDPHWELLGYPWVYLGPLLDAVRPHWELLGHPLGLSWTPLTSSSGIIG